MASFWMRGRTRAAGVLLLCLGLFVFLISGCGDAIKKAEMSKIRTFRMRIFTSPIH